MGAAKGGHEFLILLLAHERWSYRPTHHARFIKPSASQAPAPAQASVSECSTG